jgi:DNA-binding MarR family transcriptional regulator
MADTDKAKALAEEVLDCVSFRLRRTARMVAKRYDDALRPVGLRNTQFSVLGALAYLGETGIGELAVQMATDGTTLTRNLDVLVRRGLIENVPAKDGRVRRVRLTSLGQETLEEALPLWRAAQTKTLKSMGSDTWLETRQILADIEAVEAG